jgi:serine phosphatase RsbU (regulator of sigma subunit)
LDRESGHERWLVVKTSQYRDDRDRALAVNVIEDVTETKESELRERFLAHAGEVLSSSLEFEDTLQRVARLAVPELADWCGVELVDEHGDTRQVAVAHVDPAKVEFAIAVREQYPPDPDAPNGVPAVLRTGQAELYPTITDELLVAGARDEEHLRLSRELHMRSAMIVPMRTGESVIGAITFVAAETKGAYDEQDLAFAQELASRAATAVENARIYHERSQTAETLQRSLLPATLPSLPGWRAATLYRPADQVSQIGGDFFDLFRAADGFTVVLGDVTGKGVTAAAVTALARHSTKTAALLGLSPAGILRLLNRTLLDEPELSLLTVVCAHVTEHRDRVEMTIASGGHPLPLRRRAGEHPVELGAPGVLLGVDSEGGWPETAWVIEPGDTLLFYTDGVTDTPGVDARFGETRLQNLLADSSRDPDGLLAYIDAALREYQVGTHVDDTAMLALQFVGEQLPPSSTHLTGRAPVADPPRQ